MHEKQRATKERIERFLNDPIIRGLDLLLVYIYKRAIPTYYINGRTTYGIRIEYDESTEALIGAIKTRREEYIKMKYHKEEIEQK